MKAPLDVAHRGDLLPSKQLAHDSVPSSTIKQHTKLLGLCLSRAMLLRRDALQETAQLNHTLEMAP